MSPKPSVCREIEPALVAAATGDASAGEAQRVDVHVRLCAPCREDFARYRALEGVVETWGRAPAAPGAGVAEARERLTARLADLRRRILAYRVFESPLGPILIARSEDGVSLVEYLTGGRDLRHSCLARVAGVEPLEDGAEVETLYRELLEYLEGRRTRLDWPLDFRLARSDFHRTVLRATAGIPYGAVTSYAGLASEIGKPAATRAVAQALRWNPLPIVVPCHRVVGSSGALVGYAGNKTGLKQRLLAVEGVRAVRAHHELRLPLDTMYVQVPDGTAYCLPTCDWLAHDRPRRLVRFGTRTRAEAAGLEPCTDCRPDLHPLES